MNKAVLLGTTGAAVALAMLAVGFVAGNPQMAKAGTTQSVQTAAADTKIDRTEVEARLRK